MSACLGLMMYASLAPPAETSISWTRPSKYFRGLLSLNVWVPIATLSYSLYLWHPCIMAVVSVIYVDSVSKIDKLSTKDSCEEIVSLGLYPSVGIFIFGSVISIFEAMISYLFIEKPAIDARRVFKSKWEK